MRLIDIQAAAKAFKDAIKGDVATDAEIDARERICFLCPERKKVTGAASRVSKILGTLANRHRVPERIKDYRCNVCKCSLMLLLPATPADFHVDSPEEAVKRSKTKCWMRTP